MLCIYWPTYKALYYCTVYCIFISFKKKRYSTLLIVCKPFLYLHLFFVFLVSKTSVRPQVPLTVGEGPENSLEESSVPLPFNSRNNHSSFIVSPSLCSRFSSDLFKLTAIRKWNFITGLGYSTLLTFIHWQRHNNITFTFLWGELKFILIARQHVNITVHISSSYSEVP